MISRVIGVDPSITATGLAEAHGMLQTVGGDSKLGDKRLEVIYDAIVTTCLIGTPHLAVVEDLPTHAHGAGITGMAQCAVRLALLQRGVPYALVPPSALKKYATGSGNATKADMRMALYQRADIDIRDDNQVDAWWLRHMGLDHLGSAPLDLPKAQRAVMEKVGWPE